MSEAVVVDDTGVTVPRRYAEPLDVQFDGARVWSFNPARDGDVVGQRVRAAWPPPLAERLRGTTAVRVVPHNGGDVLFERTISFGGVTEPLVLVDEEGNQLAVDKTGRLQRTFDRVDEDSRRHLVEATRRVLDDLREVCDMDAYLVYGALLGARREGKMIGHDSDTDVAYLSKFTHPFDIIRECREAEERMRARGWAVARMSAANFKVWVPLPNGAKAGVDVFGSFFIGDHFHLTGSLRGKLPREAIMPFGTIELEGVTMPAPADVDAFLAYTYGPGWKVPDPAFHFDHPPENMRMMTSWWRGTRRNVGDWQTFYSGSTAAQVPTKPSAFARWVQGQLKERGLAEGTLVDVGAGNGRDAVFFAKRGYDVHAYDYSSKGRLLARQLARRRDVTIHLSDFSAASPRDVLIRGAQLARLPGPVHLYARGLLDNLPPDSRTYLWRLCQLAQRRGGLTFLEFRTPESRSEPKHFGPRRRYYPGPERVRAEIEAHGGTVVELVTGRDLAVLGTENPHVCRMIVRWQ